MVSRRTSYSLHCTLLIQIEIGAQRLAAPKANGGRDRPTELPRAPPGAPAPPTEHDQPVLSEVPELLCLQPERLPDRRHVPCPALDALASPVASLPDRDERMELELGIDLGDDPLHVALLD